MKGVSDELSKVRNKNYKNYYLWCLLLTSLVSKDQREHTIYCIDCHEC